jgi:uncharacterized repeat protein (TIGR03803 family)
MRRIHCCAIAAFAFLIPLVEAAAYTEKVLHQFRGGPDGLDPVAGLVADGAGSLYGTTQHGGDGCPSQDATGCGTAFRLSPPGPGQTAWTYKIYPDS